MKAAIGCLAALIVAACASGSPAAPVNRPLAHDAAPALSADLGLEGDAVALAFSGGGARSAAFSYGVLLGLRDMRSADGGRLIDRIALITSVSGGAIPAAWFGLHGDGGLDEFRPAFLDKAWQDHIRTNWLSPLNWVRFAQGGLNAREQLGEWLDAEVFAGARFSDMKQRPLILISAADLSTGLPFVFAAPWFDALCSDLAGFHVSDAVGASMSVPLAFRPTPLAAYPSRCARSSPGWTAAARSRSASPTFRDAARAFESYRDPARADRLQLVDGGVVDNFGVTAVSLLRDASETPYGPFLSARDAVRLRSLTFVVVNAETISSRDWVRDGRDPDAADIIDATIDTLLIAAKRNAFDAFAGRLWAWERDIVEWRCALTPAEARALGAGDGWSCGSFRFALDTISFADLPGAHRRRVEDLPTAVSLPPQAIDDLVAGGLAAAQANEALGLLRH